MARGVPLKLDLSNVAHAIQIIPKLNKKSSRFKPTWLIAFNSYNLLLSQLLFKFRHSSDIFAKPE